LDEKPEPEPESAKFTGCFTTASGKNKLKVNDNKLKMFQ